MNRRTAIISSVLGVAGIASFIANGRTASTPPSEKLMTDNTPKLDPNPSTIERFELSDQQWLERLDEQAYYVLRKEGTERPFTSPLNDEKREGDFACAGCGLVLFNSATKFDSGTGWPSFWDHVADRIETKTDYKLLLPRTEYHCARCGGHQGHVFKDGPKPTNLRYCNNGVALTFIPA